MAQRYLQNAKLYPQPYTHFLDGGRNVVIVYVKSTAEAKKLIAVLSK